MAKMKSQKRWRSDTKRRILAGASAVKSVLHQDGVFTRLYDQAIDSFVGGVSTSPPPLSLTTAEMKSMVRTVLPPDWALKQVDGAVDEVVPYFTKDKGSISPYG